MSDTATIRSESLAVEIVVYGAAIRSVRLSGVEHSLIVGVADLNHYASGNRDYFGATRRPLREPHRRWPFNYRRPELPTRP